MKLKSLKEIMRVLQVSVPFDLKDQPVVGFSVDSRAIKPGELYVALKGERVDGHDFLKDVRLKGASAALVSSSYKGPDDGLVLLVVDDPLKSLQELARKKLTSWPVRIVAVTGSVGKTTTKEFIKTLLQAKYRVSASPGNSNSQIGVPLTILNHATGDEEILVLEMGMTTKGQLASLVKIAPPEVAVITSVALVHACHFDCIEQIAEAKAEIFSCPTTRLGILAADSPAYQTTKTRGQCRKLSFSITSKEADYYIAQDDPDTIRAVLENKEMSLSSLAIPGRHNRHNLLAAVSVARYFDVSWDEIKGAIAQLELPTQRLQFVEHKGILFLNDSYNACEVSVKAALELLPTPMGTGNKIAVLGSMMELGKFSEECHRRVGSWALRHVDRMYCLGDECLPIDEAWKEAGRPVELFVERSALIDSLRRLLKPNDVVLLKGSRSKELWKVLEEL